MPDQNSTTRLIPLTKGKFAIVDSCDFDFLNQWKWRASAGPYAVRMLPRVKGKTRVAVHMHRVILGTPEGLVTDHINGDGLDNRRANLRNATSSQNSWNSKRQRNNTSGIKGVSWHKPGGKWQVRIGVAGKQKHIGLFDSRELAEQAYAEASKQIHGDFASNAVQKIRSKF